MARPVNSTSAGRRRSPTKDEPADRDEAVGSSTGEDPEGLAVAVPCRLDEIALHRSLRLPARPG
jgi:hypothetical protein